MALAGREKAMGFVWFFLGALLIGSVLWVAYDETFGRRTWKEYASQWQQMEEERLSKAIEKEEKKIDQAKIKKIAMEREQVQNMLTSGEYAQAQQELADVKTNYQDAKTDLQFAKADLDEVFYQWKHAQHDGHDFSSHKARFESLEKQIAELTKIEVDWDSKLKAAQEKVNSFDKKLKDLESQESALYEKVTPLKRQLEAARDRGAPIEQYVVDDLGKAGPVNWGGVDRCTTCHIPTMIPGHEKGKNPFKTHPNLEKIFDAHPVESYGCVTCHGGQGRATQIKGGKPLEKGDLPHGFDHYWLEPLMRGDYIQSTCNKCHIQQFVLDMAPVYTQGKNLFVEYACINCHNAKGLEWAPKSGPDLRKIKDKVYPEWMYAWVKKPTDYLPHTKMPQVPWKNDQEVVQAIAYLYQNSEAANFKYGDFAGGDATAGQQTFEKVGCIACHNIGGKGGNNGPALDRIAEKTTGRWIYNWIQEPKNWSTHARMPSLRLTGDEARNVTAYLLTKGQKPSVDAKLEAAFLDESNAKAGQKVISTYGCYACHYIKGFEDMGKPSVDLTGFGRKDVHELAFGDAKIPETWEAWTDGKLRNPQMFVDERSSSVMPKPNITDEQRHALLVFLRGQRPENIPDKYLAFDAEIEKGRQLVYRYNCQACHVVEGKGGDVSQWITESNFLPPNLASTGSRLTTEWMSNFLKNPAHYPKVRTWLDIRMPTFGFTDAEVDELVRYFKKSAGVATLLEQPYHPEISNEEIQAAKELIGNNNFACGSCHIIGNEIPAAGPTVWAPNLAYGQNRLRPQWVNEWIRDPAKLVPGIRMPGFYPEAGAGPDNVLGGDDEKQIQAIVDYLFYLGNGGSIVSSGTSATVESTESKPNAGAVESAPAAAKQ